MSWPPVAADLYVHGAASSYFEDAAGNPLTTEITAHLSAALGKLSRKVGPRVGGPASSWTWTDAAGQEDATADVCIVAASTLALRCGLTLPGEGADPQWLRKAQEVEALWDRMGTVGRTPAEPLYAGLVDATPLVTEGAARGWYTAFDAANDEAEA